MSKIEWIKHRRPTELDGDASGDVLTRDGLVYYTEVISGVEWIPVLTTVMSKKDAEIERLRELVGFAYSEGFFKAGRPLAEGDLGRISTFSLSAWYKEEWKKSETKQMLENEVSDG